FANHLDRQVHGIHCSFVPGITEASTEGSGCQVTLMSRYSSVFRSSFWGGIPISLPAMATFAFLAFFGVYQLATGAHAEKRSAGFSLLAWTLPLLASIVMGYLSLVELGAACKLCIGIYTASALGFFSTLGQYLGVSEPALRFQPGPADATINEADATAPGMAHFHAPARQRSIWWAIPLGILFVLVPTGAYVAAMPSYDAYAGGCGELASPEDRYNILVPLGGSVAGRDAIEVLDPLCPSCRGFEERLKASGLDQQLHRKALLFPLDDSCNWMVSAAVHPGACEISEAMLCSPDQANAILDWSFANQEAIMAAERAQDGAAGRMVTAQFPSTRGCVGSARAVSRLHRGLRWAVANELPVLTPQL
ncbi:MAG: hypothetical protein H5U40_01735, partial [Polyangiaceae bacterium]|nr:hypothetical protein [Polyangiaceae bacterium]